METQYDRSGVTPPLPVPRTSPLAIWSLVLSILGLICLLCFGSIPGVILGHMALTRIRASGGTLTGNGIATTGLILGYLGLAMTVVVVLLGGLLLPALSMAREKARQTSSMNNLSQIGMAVALYEADHDETPPPNFKSLAEYVGGENNSKLFLTPGSETVPGIWEDVDSWSDYQLVTNATGARPNEAVRAFSKPDCYPGKGGLILFQDGHVGWQELDDYNRLTQPFQLD
jgi:type II secretory pathway pseudopilin PulG